MLGRECDLKMYLRNLGHPLPLKIGGGNTFFRRLHNLTATLTTYIVRMKQEVHNRVSAPETTRGLLRRLKMS